METTLKKIQEEIERENNIHKCLTENEKNRHQLIISHLNQLLTNLRNNRVKNGTTENANQRVKTRGSVIVNNVQSPDLLEGLKENTSNNLKPADRSAKSGMFKSPTLPKNNAEKKNDNNSRNTPTGTKKMVSFVSEPARNKTVDQIPGIGPQASAALERRNIINALQLIGRALCMTRDEFLKFLCDTGIHKHHAELAWCAINEYERHNL